mgnify:FL=1
MEFTVDTIINASPERIYEAWLDSDEHSDMTGGDALITDDVDDKFSAWDGYIWGTTLELRENEYIKQTWRTQDFEDDQDYSTVEIFFEAVDEGTKITIKHTDLSDADEKYKQGWIDSYFTPMKEYFEG